MKFRWYFLILYIILGLLISFGLVSARENLEKKRNGVDPVLTTEIPATVEEKRNTRPFTTDTYIYDDLETTDESSTDTETSTTATTTKKASTTKPTTTKKPTTSDASETDGSESTRPTKPHHPETEAPTETTAPTGSTEASEAYGY